MNNLDDLIAVLNKKKIVKANGCWILDLMTDPTDGYFKVCIKGSNYYAHRISAAYYLGLDLDNKKQLACHKDDICFTKACWNPDHLYVGDYSTNNRDSIRAGSNIGCFNRDKTHCPQGHEYTKENTFINRGSRICRECARLSNKKYRERNKK